MAKYLICKCKFLGQWSVQAPDGEGETFDHLSEAVAWMDIHAWLAFEQFFQTHDAPERPARRL